MRLECLDENTVIRFFRGELSPPELSSVDGHMDQCAVCRVLISSLASTQMKAAPFSTGDSGSGSGPVMSGAPTEPQPPPSSAIAPGIVLSSRFEVEKLVGVGGMGQVFRGKDRETGTTVAIKLTFGRSPDEVRRFEREAKLLRSLEHPGIVRHIKDGRDADGTPYLVMEWLDGEDLGARLQRGPLDVAETVTLGLRVADALAAAHAVGVVHRDIKPTNIFLRGGRVDAATVLDFGVARPSWLEATTNATRTGTLLGTLGYMAPEQALRAKTADARADIFSLGCVLFECLVGERMFGGAHAVEVLANVLTQPIQHPRDKVPGVPAALDALVVAMVARDSAQRPSDCGMIVAALEGLSIEDRPPASTSARTWGRRGLVVAAALATALAIVAAPRLRTATKSPAVVEAPASAPSATASTASSIASLPPPVEPAPSAPASSASVGPAPASSRAEPRVKRIARPPADPFGTFRN